MASGKLVWKQHNAWVHLNFIARCLTTIKIHSAVSAYCQASTNYHSAYLRPNVNTRNKADIVHWSNRNFADRIFYMRLGSFWHQNDSFYHFPFQNYEKIQIAFLRFQKFTSPKFWFVNKSICLDTKQTISTNLLIHLFTALSFEPYRICTIAHQGQS